MHEQTSRAGLGAMYIVRRITSASAQQLRMNVPIDVWPQKLATLNLVARVSRRSSTEARCSLWVVAMQSLADH